MGMPFRYSLEVHQAIVESVADGAPFEAAADAAGVAKRSVMRWLARGREALARWEEHDLDEQARADDPDWQWVQFALDVDTARGKTFAKAAKVVTDAAWGSPAEYDAAGNCIRAEVRPDPKLALDFLARRDPDNWGRTHQAPTRTTTDELADSDMAELADRGEALVRELVALTGDE